MKTPIDLSTVPAPDVVETIDFNSIVSSMVADLQSRDSSFSALVESDPAWKVLEVAAYREILIRQRVNDAAKAVMLPYATGADLDNLAAFFGVVRLVITPADTLAIPPTPAVMETDSALRYRVTLALDGISTAGAVNSYIFHALAEPRVLDVSVAGPMTSGAEIDPGHVVVSILGNHAADGTNVNANGSVNSVITDAVAALLNAEDVRPLTDYVNVQSAIINNYAVAATIYTLSGPDPSVVIASATAALNTYISSVYKIGRTVTRAGIISSLYAPGVENVILSDLQSGNTGDVTNDFEHCGYCTGISITNGGVAE